MEKYFGLYPATVTNNVDPESTGRLQLTIPDVLGETPSSWAEACAPLAGAGAALGVYLVPPVGAGVWVQFVQGEPDRPVWVGCRWGSRSDLPSDAQSATPALPPIVLQSANGHKLVISDEPGPTGGFTLETAGGSKVVISDQSITLSIGSSKIDMSQAKVTINDGALEIQ